MDCDSHKKILNSQPWSRPTRQRSAAHQLAAAHRLRTADIGDTGCSTSITCDMRTAIEECDKPVINFIRDIQGSKFLREGVMTNRIKRLCKVQREQRDIEVGGQ